MFLKALSVSFLIGSVFLSSAGCSSSKGNGTLVSPGPDPSSRVRAFKEARTESKYIAFLDNLDFFEAWQMCHFYGLKLASVTSPAETNEIKSAITQANPPNGLRFWIAGTDLGRTKSFLWITNGLQIWRPNFYLNWSPGQPDNYKGIEHCVEIMDDGLAGWNDRDCGVREGYICQRVDSEC